MRKEHALCTAPIAMPPAAPLSPATGKIAACIQQVTANSGESAGKENKPWRRAIAGRSPSPPTPACNAKARNPPLRGVGNGKRDSKRGRSRPGQTRVDLGRWLPLQAVRSPDVWRALEKATALSTLIGQRHLAPSCRGLALSRREQWPGKDGHGEPDTDARNSRHPT